MRFSLVMAIPALRLDSFYPLKLLAVIKYILKQQSQFTLVHRLLPNVIKQLRAPALENKGPVIQLLEPTSKECSCFHQNMIVFFVERHEV